MRHLGSATVRQLGSGDGGASAAAGLEQQQEGAVSKPRAAEQDYDAGDPRRQTYHVVISSGVHAVGAWDAHQPCSSVGKMVASSMSATEQRYNIASESSTVVTIVAVPIRCRIGSLAEVCAAKPCCHANADGSVYNQWQSRICYWHIQKLKAADPHGAMGGFTRLLHR